MTTGERIKQARKKSNMTQKELADKIGTTHQNISQYERDLRNPKIETLQKIADALNVSDDYEPLDIKKEYLHYRRLYEESETQIATLKRALELACEEISDYALPSGTGRMKSVLITARIEKFMNHAKQVQEQEAEK